MAERQRRWTWQVHESTTRALCQLTFVLFGLLPLGLCLVWSVQQFLPTYQRHQARHWEQYLTTQLGVAVKVGAYESRAPERFALHEIRLNHPETGTNICRVRLAEFERREGKWAIRLTQADLEGSELATAWLIAHNAVLCRLQSNAQETRVGMSDLTIHTSNGVEHVLRDVTATLLPSSETTELKVQFHTDVVSTDTLSSSPGSTMRTARIEEQAKPIQWNVTRRHRAAELKTVMQLRTGAARIPVGLLTAASPWIDRLGEQATFSGALDVELCSDSWRATLTAGLLSQLEMQQLTADSDVALSGTGDVLFERLVIGQQGIELARGGGEIREGKIAADLFHALEKYLGVAARGTNQVSAYGFDQFQFLVDIQQSKLHLKCQMVDAHGPLAARDNWDEAIPLERVVAALAVCGAHSQSVASGSDAASLPTTWLSKQALVWLPLGDPHWQAAQAQMRLSSHQLPNGNP